MKRGPQLDIAKLREIGLERWDPIGTWVPADEYDSYLLKAGGNLWNGQSVAEVADYLVRIEVEDMALGVAPGIHERALRVAAEINDHVQSLRTVNSAGSDEQLSES